MSANRMQSVVDVHVLFLNDQNECLFLRRANTGYKDGQYSLVAGHLERNESIEECAIREAAEEANVGVNAIDLKLECVMRRDAEQNRISFFFECRTWTGCIENNEPEKCDDLTWRKLTDLPNPMVDYVAAAINDIQKGKILSDFSPRS